MDTLDLNKFHPNPSKPTFVLPRGAVDAHCHIFGPGDVFPYSPKRKYTPGDASKEDLFRLRDFLGVSRNVIVQASCHGTDNTATIDGIKAAGERARGIAVVDLRHLARRAEGMDAAGIRGVRFAFLKRLVDPTPPERYQRIIEMCRQLGWHVVVYFESADLEIWRRSSGRFRRRWSSITWAGPTSSSASTIRSGRASCGCSTSTRTFG